MSDKKLIRLVQQHQELYDSNSPKYLDTAHRAKVWRDIGLRLNKSGLDCKRRWCSLRDQYRRYVRKCSDECVPYKKWKYEEEISFIRNYVRERGMTFLFGSLVDGSSDELADFGLKIGPAVTLQRGESTPNLSTIALPPLPPEETAAVPSPSPTYQEPPQSQTESPSDPLSAFFDGIQASVRTFSPYYQNVAKARIFNVVSQLELTQIVEKPTTTEEPNPLLPVKLDPDG